MMLDAGLRGAEIPRSGDAGCSILVARNWIPDAWWLVSGVNAASGQQNGQSNQ